MKKTFEVEARRTSFVTMWVEAETLEEAEALAHQEIAAEYYSDNASWDIEYIEEAASTTGEA